MVIVNLEDMSYEKNFITVIALLMLALAGCSCSKETDHTANTNNMTSVNEENKDTIAQNATYKQISQEEAKEMMKRDDAHIIVDVRRQDEYDSGHISGAILIPNESIGTTRPNELKDLNQIILVYCRTGNRSKQAAQKLADMGYTNVFEFGGINTWDGDIVR